MSSFYGGHVQRELPSVPYDQPEPYQSQSLLSPIRREPSYDFNLAPKEYYSIQDSQTALHTKYPPEPQGGAVSVQSRHGHISFVILIPSLVLIVLCAGLGVFLLLWLTTIKGVAGPKGLGASIRAAGAFIADEGSHVVANGSTSARLLALTITTVTSSVVSISVPFITGLSAYCIAGMWLSHQNKTSSTGVGAPTPLQYGLLVKLLGVSGIVSIYDGIRYLHKSTSRRAQAPSYLMITLILTAVLFSLSHLISLADLWLHTTAYATIRNVTTPISTPFQYAMAMNESVCTQDDPFRACLVDGDGWGTFEQQVKATGYQIVSNISEVMTVITLSKQADLAVIVPTTVESSVSFDASSFGIRSTCTNLTPKCFADLKLTATDCTPAGYPQLPFNKTSTSGGLAGTNGFLDSILLAEIGGTLVGGTWGAWDAPPKVFPTNPQTFMVQLTWALNIDDNGSSTPNTVGNDPGNGQVYAFMACDLSFYNLTLRYTDGTYDVVGDPELSIPVFTSAMSAPLLYQLVDLQLLSNLEARILNDQNDNEILAAVNQEISRLTLGMFAGATMSVPSTNQTLTAPNLVGCYPLAPVVVFVFLLFLYCAIALAIFVWTATISSPLVESPTGETVPSVQLVQMHLTDSLALVASNFSENSGSAAKLTVAKDAVQMFGEDENAERLAVGIHNLKTKEPGYGIYQRSKTWSPTTTYR